MTFGMMFQEYYIKWPHIVKGHKFVSQLPTTYTLKQGVFLRLVWLAATTFLVQFYTSQLKASFIIHSYEDVIQSIDEMLERLEILIVMLQVGSIQ